jgi:hypothetical protein
MGNSMWAVLRSLGFLGGRPIRLFAMRINIYRKRRTSTIASRTYYMYK